MNLKGKSFLKLLDFTPEEIQGLIDMAYELKKQKKTLKRWHLFCLQRMNTLKQASLQCLRTEFSGFSFLCFSQHSRAR